MAPPPKLIGVVVLLGLPVLVAVLWLSSGRETLTKSHKIVAVTLSDEIFGGTDVQQRFIRGPLLGYYVGLDLVGTVTAAAIVTGLIWRWAARRKRRTAPKAEENAWHVSELDM
jgi:hypothetical protein